jgi:hypothetical protein
MLGMSEPTKKTRLTLYLPSGATSTHFVQKWSVKKEGGPLYFQTENGQGVYTTLPYSIEGDVTEGALSLIQV